MTDWDFSGGKQWEAVYMSTFYVQATLVSIVDWEQDITMELLYQWWMGPTKCRRALKMWSCLHDVVTPRWGCDILWQHHTYTVSHWPCCSHPGNNLVNYCCSVNGEVTSHYNWSILTLMKSNLITLISNLSGPWFGDPNLSDWQDITGGTAVSHPNIISDWVSNTLPPTPASFLLAAETGDS